MKQTDKVSSTKSIFIFAGEKSGDLHGSYLVKALRKTAPSFDIEGVPGPKMRDCGVRELFKMEDFEVMGLTDVLLTLPKLYRQFRAICKHILKTAPEATILIDSPSFNLRLAKELRHRGYQGKIIQYVSPTVWAWGSHRIDAMAKTTDLLLTIYPFELAYFKNSPLKVSFVGNPLQEYLKNYEYNDLWKEKVQIPSDAPLLAIFPGSREAEIIRNLPVMLDAAEAMHTDHPEILFAISCGHPNTHKVVHQVLSKRKKEIAKKSFLIPKNFSYELMRDSRCALAKSGTVTLELALHHCPTTVLYTLTRLNRFYAKYILKLNLPYYCIVNILSGACVFPEFIEKAPSKDSLKNSLNEVYKEGAKRTKTIEMCQAIADSLGESKASENAANAIKGLLQW